MIERFIWSMPALIDAHAHLTIYNLPRSRLRVSTGCDSITAPGTLRTCIGESLRKHANGAQARRYRTHHGRADNYVSVHVDAVPQLAVSGQWTGTSTLRGSWSTVVTTVPASRLTSSPLVASTVPAPPATAPIAA